MAIEGTVSETRGGKRKVMGRMVRSKVDPVVSRVSTRSRKSYRRRKKKKKWKESNIL